MKHFIANKTSKGKQYLIVSLIVVCVSVICFAFSSFIGYRVTAFVLLVTVSIIAMLFDILPVLLAALLSALIWDFFFIPPRFTFNINSTEDTIMFLMYFVIASVSSVLTYKIRQITKIAREEEEKAKSVKLYNTLFNSLSHELRTPISTILGASDTILNDRATEKISEENKYKLVEEISRASLRLTNQVENLLNISRIESGIIKAKKDWCDVNELIHSTTNQIEDTLKNHILIISPNEDIPLVKIDFGLTQQIIHNILSNASQYTHKGSTISIRAEIKKTTVSSYLIIQIEDNGNGFPEDEIKNVFDKFYRLKNSKSGGTGLGLAIAKGFTEAQGGIIKLSNRPSGGARFTIELPTETSNLNNKKHE